MMRISRAIPLMALMALPFLCLTVSGQVVKRANSNPGWVADNGDGTYKNPIIYADYSDPDIVRAGDDFYLVSSSFNCTPAIPVLHSKDLVNWTIIGHVFQKFPSESFNAPRHGGGVWAPAIRFHNGYFYVYFPDPDIGIFMSKSKNPAGPWDSPVLVKEASGAIDPCPLWDDDGSAYLVHAWAMSRAGINSIITVNKMNPEGTKVLDQGKMVFDGHANHPTIEGPKFYKRNGYYYIFAPAGGVVNGWQTVLRSKNVWGPYEDKIVLDQGKTEINGPHQGGMVELKSGETWFVHFQDRGPYGRIIHLQPVKWVNDWPVIGIDREGKGKGEPALIYRKPKIGIRYPVAVPQTSDEFNSKTLGLQWQWQANYRDNWMTLTAKPGALRLYAIPVPKTVVNLYQVPNLLLQKFPAPEFTVTTKLDISHLGEGETTGLLIMGMDYSYLFVRKTPSGLLLIKSTCKRAETGGREAEDASTNYSGDFIFLRVKVSSGAKCDFSYSANGNIFTKIGETFTARAGRWIGAKVGIFTLTGPEATTTGFTDYDWFRFE